MVPAHSATLRPEPPFVVHRIVRAGSAPAVEALYRREFGAEHSRTTHGSDEFEYKIEFIRAQDSGFSRIFHRGESTIRAAIPGSFATVHLPSREPSMYRVGRRRLQRGPRNGVVLFPGHDYTVRVLEGSVRAFFIPLTRLIEEIDARRAGRTRPWPTGSLEIPLDLLGRVDVEDAARKILGAATDEDRLARFREWERDSTARLACALLGLEGALAAAPMALKIAEDVERWICRHLAEPITLEMLTAVAGISERWLQKSFRQRWGQTPLELVMSRRLAAVRTRLLSPDPNASITAVAIGCGFTHLGRFSAAYREAYGERPSDTVERARNATTGIEAH